MAELMQAGAIPYRRRGDSLEFLLITSRSGRWIFPKGLVEPGETPEETALKECLEEAGIRGHLQPGCVGTYRVRKWRHEMDVQLFLLAYDADVEPWEERDLRQRRWLSYEDAARCVKDELRGLLTTARDNLIGARSA